MNGIQRSVFLVCLYFGSIMLTAVPVAAQGAPAVNLSCTSPYASGTIEVQVYPGAALSGYAECSVSNPNAYIERIDVRVDADGLVVAAPGVITLGSNGESNFQVVVRADQRMPMSSRNLRITATVTDANGVPVTTPAESSTNMIIGIQQYSRLQVEADVPFLQLQPKTDHNFMFKVSNQGNQVDKFKVGVTDETMAKLESADFQISMPVVSTEINAQDQPVNVRVMVRTPKNQGWSDEYHTLEFFAESVFSCTYELTGCNRMSQPITIYVRGVYLPGFELIPSLSMVALAAAAIARRKLGNEDDEEEWFEAAPGL
jgi:hypothetical protein